MFFDYDWISVRSRGPLRFFRLILVLWTIMPKNILDAFLILILGLEARLGLE